MMDELTKDQLLHEIAEMERHYEAIEKLNIEIKGYLDKMKDLCWDIVEEEAQDDYGEHIDREVKGIREDNG